MRTSLKSHRKSVFWPLGRSCDMATNEQLELNDIDLVKDYLQTLQNHICASLEHLDGQAVFAKDRWERDAGGGGESRVLTGGAVFEQAGVGFSHVFGSEMPSSATKTSPPISPVRNFRLLVCQWCCTLITLMSPTTTCQFSLFFTAGSSNPVWWFGGGFDLTPYYPFS